MFFHILELQATTEQDLGHEGTWSATATTDQKLCLCGDA